MPASKEAASLSGADTMDGLQVCACQARGLDHRVTEYSLFYRAGCSGHLAPITLTKEITVFTSLPTTPLDAARRTYIACAWTVALTGEEDLEVAAAQMFYVIADLVEMFGGYHA